MPARPNLDVITGGRALEGGGGGDHTGGMDIGPRVAALEGDMKEVKTDLKSLVKDVAELKGRIMSMPTTWQLLSVNFTLAIGVAALVFAIARFMH